MLQRRSLSVPVDGGELSVEVTGPTPNGALPAVLLLHDLASNAVVWRLVTSRIDESLTTLAIDARGRAASAALPEPFGMRAHVDDAVAVLDHFAVQSAVVVGHGTGAVTAANLAAERPDRVAGAVLVDGGVPLRVGGDPRLAIDSALLPLLHQLRIVHSDRDVAVLEARRFSSAGLAEHVVEETVLHDLTGQPPHVGRRTNEAAVWFDGSELLLDPSISRAVERVGVPVELLRVDVALDHSLPEALFVEALSMAESAELERRLPHLSVVTVPGLDHEAIVLHPQGADAISRSIARLVARSVGTA